VRGGAAAAPAVGTSGTGAAGLGPVLGLALAAGAGMAVQSRINGSFALRVAGSDGAVLAPVLAALASFSVGTVAVTAVALASAPGRRALRRPGPGAVRVWMLSGGLLGAFVVSVAALAVPVVGVALYSVGVVAGQTTGGLLVDRLGIGPGGRRALTAPRVVGAVLAVVAVGLGAVGVRAGPGSVLLLLGVAGGGLALATQAAVNARLAVALGDPRAASVVSFVVGSTALAALAATLLVATDPTFGEVPPAPLWLGGLIGATYIGLTTAFVGRVGVLRWSLALVAGQLAGALVLDVAAPVPGQGLTPAAVAGALLTLVAVAVAGRPARVRAGVASTIGR
jgi:transporter family-2 protein